MQRELTTNWDGSAKHGKWQEPAGTPSMALSAYIQSKSFVEENFTNLACCSLVRNDQEFQNSFALNFVLQHCFL